MHFKNLFPSVLQCIMGRTQMEKGTSENCFLTAASNCILKKIREHYLTHNRLMIAVLVVNSSLRGNLSTNCN
jgi:hypothetical protein